MRKKCGSVSGLWKKTHSTGKRSREKDQPHCRGVDLEVDLSRDSNDRQTDRKRETMTDRHSQTEAGCQTKEDRNEERETDGQAVQTDDRQRWTERSGQTEQTKRLVHCA